MRNKLSNFTIFIIMVVSIAVGVVALYLAAPDYQARWDCNHACYESGGRFVTFSRDDKCYCEVEYGKIVKVNPANFVTAGE